MTTHKSIEEMSEDLRNKILDIETAVRLTYNERDSDQMIEKLLNYYSTTLQSYTQQQVQEAVEAKDYEKILTIGYHKGEMDFGVNCAIEDLDLDEMQAFRQMLVVAIGQAESMWRAARERKDPPTTLRAQVSEGDKK